MSAQQDVVVGLSEGGRRVCICEYENSIICVKLLYVILCYQAY